MSAGKGLHVVLVAPTGRDAAMIADALKVSNVQSEAFNDVASAVDVFHAKDVGVMLIAEEALDDETIALLFSVLARQPAWSALPVLILTMGGQTLLQSRRLGGNGGRLATLSCLKD